MVEGCARYPSGLIVYFIRYTSPLSPFLASAEMKVFMTCWNGYLSWQLCAFIAEGMNEFLNYDSCLPRVLQVEEIAFEHTFILMALSKPMAVDSTSPSFDGLASGCRDLCASWRWCSCSKGQQFPQHGVFACRRPKLVVSWLWKTGQSGLLSNIFVVVISRLLHCCYVRFSSYYSHKFSGSRYMLPGFVVGAKLLLSQMDRVLVLLPKGLLLCWRISRVEGSSASCSLSKIQVHEHLTEQREEYLQNAAMLKWGFDLELLMIYIMSRWEWITHLTRGFTPFYTNLVGPWVYVSITQ